MLRAVAMVTRAMTFRGVTATWTADDWDACRDLPPDEVVFIHEFKALFDARVVTDRSRRSVPCGTK